MKVGRRTVKRGDGPTKKQYLFAYSDLQRNGEPSNVIARGDLRVRNTDEGADGAARFSFGDHGIVYGQRLPVSDDTLRFLDGVERPEYERVKIDTSTGPAWAYQYAGDNFDKLEPVPDGNWLAYLRKLRGMDDVMKP